MRLKINPKKEYTDIAILEHFDKDEVISGPFDERLIGKLQFLRFRDTIG